MQQGTVAKKNMAKAIKIDIITRETIKPASPTPEHLRYIKLSFLDQMAFAMSTPVILFYPLKGNNHDRKVMSQQLKLSFSKVLALFYPLAGRVKDNILIECNDNGVEYIEAKASCPLSEIFQEPDIDVLEKLLPVNLDATKTFTGATIQVNFFSCGGLAIGVSLSHKICDGISLATFIMAWASTSLADIKSLESPHNQVVHPKFVSDSIIPALKDVSILLPPQPLPPPETLQIAKYKTRRYVFDASKVTLLKAKATSTIVQRPTRVEAVTGLIWKCLMTISRSNSGCPRQSAVMHAVNLRKRFVPPLPQNFVGNLTGRFLAKTNEIQIDLPDLVACLRKGLEHTGEHVVKEVQANDMLAMIEFAKEFWELHSRDDIDLYSFTSLCGFPLHEADFGWGKPTWVIATNLVLNNFGLLIDAKDGEGIEVWLSLSEEDVALLEANQELLAFATINPPPVLDTNVPALQSRM